MSDASNLNNLTPAEPKPEAVAQETAPEGTSQVEASSEAQANIPSKAEQKAIEKQLKKFKLKVDGKEYEEELDLNDEASLVKHLQMSKSAQRRMQEAAEMRKSAEEFINLLKTNPRRVLTDPNIGVDLKKLAQEVINQEIEDAQKSPEQLEKEKITRELEELREKMKKDEETRNQRELSRLQQEHEEKIQANIESALKTSDLPKTPYTVRKMAEMMLIALQNNVDLSPNELVPVIRKQMHSDIKDLFGAANDDILEELIGKERISSIRKKNVAKVKTQQQVAQTSNSVKPSGNPPKKEAEKKPEISMKDFLNGKF